MAIWRKGKPLTPVEQRKYVQSITGWGDAEYKREYNKLRNRARNYERINGYQKGTINVPDLLARRERNKVYGDTPSQLLIRVESTTSASTSSRISVKSQQRYAQDAIARIRNQYKNAINNGGFVSLAVEQLEKSTEGNYTAQELEDTILASFSGFKQLKTTADEYNEIIGIEGSYFPFDPKS